MPGGWRVDDGQAFVVADGLGRPSLQGETKGRFLVSLGMTIARRESLHGASLQRAPSVMKR